MICGKQRWSVISPPAQGLACHRALDDGQVARLVGQKDIVAVIDGVSLQGQARCFLDSGATFQQLAEHEEGRIALPVVRTGT